MNIRYKKIFIFVIDLNVKQMNIPHWNNKYNTGIEEIDYQHRYFLELINRFNTRVNNGLDEPMVHRHLTELLKYAQFHFYSEENLMMLNQFPLIEEHVELHLDLIDKLSVMLMNFEIGRASLSEILEFLIEWFIDHTVKEDTKLAAYIRPDA